MIPLSICSVVSYPRKRPRAESSLPTPRHARLGSTKYKPLAAPEVNLKYQHFITKKSVFEHMVDWLSFSDSLQLIQASKQHYCALDSFYKKKLLQAVASAQTTSSISGCPTLLGLSEGPGDLPRLPNPRDIMLRRIVASLDKMSVQQLGRLVNRFCVGIGTALATPDEINRVLAWIMQVKQLCPPDALETMMTGMCDALRDLGISGDIRDVLISAILNTSTSSSPEQLGQMIYAVSMALMKGDINPTMDDADRQAVILKILDSHVTTSAHQMGVMVRALCESLGGKAMSLENIDGLLEQILPWNLPRCFAHKCAILNGLCLCLGGEQMEKLNLEHLAGRLIVVHGPLGTQRMTTLFGALCSPLWQGAPCSERNRVVDALIALHNSHDPEQIEDLINQILVAAGGALISNANLGVLLAVLLIRPAAGALDSLGIIVRELCLGLGGQKISPVQRDLLLTTLRLKCDTIRPDQMASLIGQLCFCLGGEAISVANRDALISLVLVLDDDRFPHKIALFIGSLCSGLGGKRLSAANRDALLIKIFATCEERSADQMGELLWSMGSRLGRNEISQAHRDCLIGWVLASYRECTALQMGAMIRGLYVALGYTMISRANHLALLGQVRSVKSRLSEGQFEEMMFTLSELSDQKDPLAEHAADTGSQYRCVQVCADD